MKELLEYLVKTLVDNPDAVVVDEFEDEEEEGTVVLELTVAPDDYGKVIGRGGRTAMSLRTLVKAAAVSEDFRVELDIVESD